MNKTFRALLADSKVDQIRLSTNDGLTGYQITKFDILPIDADEDVESVVQIYSVPQTTARNTINFDDPTLLAAGIIRAGTGVSQPLTAVTVFDNMKFNQDIFVTVKGNSYTRSINYYIELQQVKLSLDEATVATLKDMRGRE